MQGQLRQTASVPDTLFAQRMFVYGVTHEAQDVVLHGGRVGLLLVCVQELGAFFGLVEMWDLVADVSSSSKRWRRTEDLELIDARELVQTVAWIQAGDGSGEVIVLV